MSAPYIDDILAHLRNGKGLNKNGIISASAIAVEMQIDYESVLLSLANGIDKGYFRLQYSGDDDGYSGIGYLPKGAS